MDRGGIHQLAATCKTNKKTTVVFRRPSDGKVSFFGRLRVKAVVISIKNVVSHLVLFFSLLWREKGDPPFMESGRFLPIKVGEGGSHFRKDDLFFFLCNCFPERAAVGSVFLFHWRRSD